MSEPIAWPDPDLDTPSNGFPMRQSAIGSTRATTNSAVRRRMVLFAVLPALLVMVIAAALVGLLIYNEGTGIDQSTWLILLIGAVFICAVLAGAGLLASAEARAVTAHTTEQWHIAAWAQSGPVGVGARRPMLPEPRDSVPPAGPMRALPPTAVTRPADPVPVGRGESWDQSEVFDHLARRLQSLVHREIGLLDELENEVEDPDLLKSIFRVDHLATRVRRYAENMAVLGGGVSDRMWTRPVSVNDVLRSAVAEIEQYRRVKLVPPVPGMMHGHAVVDVVHLLAELAENATVFSPPHTQVSLRAEFATAGLVIEVEDRGLGMSPIDRNKMNALLAARDRSVPDDLVRDGRIGLYVVATLARQHGIAVQLQSNIFGGTQAVLVLPHDLLAEPPAAVEPDKPAVEPAEREQVPAARPPAQPRPAPSQYAPAAPPPARPPAAPPAAPRPVLPTRNPQENLPAQLREPTSAAGRLEEVEHSPGLMAAFQSGVRQAEEASDPALGPEQQ